MPSVKRPAPDTLHTLRSSKKPRTELDLSSSAPGRLPTRRSSKQPRTGPKRRRAAKEGRDSANLFQRWAQIGREVWDLGKDTLTQLAIAMEGVRDHDSPRRPRSAPPPQGLKQEPEPVAGPSVLPPQARRKSLSRPPSPPASPGEQNLYADAPENSAPSGPSFPPANNLPPFQRRKSLRTSSESATPSPSSSGRQWDEIPPADGQDHTPPTSTTPGPEVPTTPRRLPPRQRKSLDWMQAESQTPFPVQTVQDPSPTRPAHMPTRTTRNTIHGSTFSTPKTLPHRQRIPVDFTRSVAPPPPSTRRVTAHYSTSHMDVDTPTRHTGAPFSIPGGYPELDAALAASGNRRRVQEITDNIPARKYQSREHIFAKNHKAQLEADRKKAQEELEQELYGYKRSRGYASDFRTFQNYLGYRATLEGLVRRDALSRHIAIIN
ncbi:hypothetical protein PLICRDRAFT_400547 [Plicaturopsis crispa FD-325 SS-3]|nr:hypothetical protein PLICRDRAFT_400547 [Plicaturopsis crispa FD-325 SS-3]